MTTVFETDLYRVDLLLSAAPSPRALAFTFTALGNKSKEGKGFGGDFLLREGIDVVAFKSTKDDWYQNFPVEAFQTIEAAIGQTGRVYTRRAAYGSSMGAYAAILFADLAKLDVLLAFSPQFAIDEPWEARWRAQSDVIGPIRRLTAGDVCAGCQYHLVYDPMDPDARHVNKFAEILPAGQLKRVLVRFSGHQPVVLLSDAGLLKQLALHVIAGDTPNISPRQIRTSAVHSAQREFAIGLKSLNAKKYRWAESLFLRSIRQYPLRWECNFHLAAVYRRLGNNDAALTYIAIAHALDPTHVFNVELLAIALSNKGFLPQALHFLEAALRDVPGSVARLQPLHDRISARLAGLRS